CDLNREPRLSDAAWPRQGDEPILPHERHKTRDLLLPAYELGQRSRQPVRASAGILALFTRCQFRLPPRSDLVAILLQSPVGLDRLRARLHVQFVPQEDSQLAVDLNGGGNVTAHRERPHQVSTDALSEGVQLLRPTQMWFGARRIPALQCRFSQ